MPRANHRSTPLPMHGTASASPSPSDATRAPGTAAGNASPGLGSPLASHRRTGGRGGGGPNNRSPAAEGGCGGRHAAGGCDADAPACRGARSAVAAEPWTQVGRLYIINMRNAFSEKLHNKREQLSYRFRGRGIGEKGSRMAIKFDLNNINTSVKLH